MKKFILILLIVLWMGIIYFFSSCNGIESKNQSIGLLDSTIGKIIVFFDNDISEERKLVIIEKLDYPIRKIAHMSEYFILAILVSLLISEYNISLLKILIISFAICFIYACSDEIHQLFVRARSGQITDVIIDSIGSSMWLIIYYLVRKKDVK